ARPRLGTYVTDRSNWNLFDGDVMGWRTTGVPDSMLVRELGEVRCIIEPAASRLAAARSSAEDVAAISDAVGMMRAAGTDGAAMIEADLVFHRAILAAAGNELLKRFEIVLEPALNARHTLAFS